MALMIYFSNADGPAKNEKPFYVFNQTGKERYITGGPGEPKSEAWIPVGKTLASFATLAEAVKAYPNATVTKDARAAVKSGFYR